MTNDQIQNPIEAPTRKKRTYDLAERTGAFGEMTIRFVKGLPETTVNRPMMSQLVRSATSIGANYMEADGAESKKDFIHKIRLCKKEAKETMHWLRMIATAVPTKKDDCRRLWLEVSQLVRIFGSIAKS